MTSCLYHTITSDARKHWHGARSVHTPWQPCETHRLCYDPSLLYSACASGCLVVPRGAFPAGLQGWLCAHACILSMYQANCSFCSQGTPFLTRPAVSVLTSLSPSSANYILVPAPSVLASACPTSPPPLYSHSLSLSPLDLIPAVLIITDLLI